MKRFIYLSLFLAVGAQASGFPDPDQALKNEVNGKLLELSSVLAKAISHQKSCTLFTTRKEIMENVQRIERSFAPFSRLDRTAKEKILNAPYLAGAMSSYLAWQLFAEGIELNRFEPKQNLPRVRELLERTAPFRPAMPPIRKEPLPFHELQLLPDGAAEVEVTGEGYRLERRKARWEFSLVKGQWGPLLEMVMVTVEFGRHRIPFLLVMENENLISLRTFENDQGQYDTSAPGVAVLAQDQFGCTL